MIGIDIKNELSRYTEKKLMKVNLQILKISD